MTQLREWILDIKTLLAFLLVALLFFWQFNGHPERLLTMADNVLTAIFSLAVGYRLGKADKQADPSNPK
jgi:hypothetical protein